MAVLRCHGRVSGCWPLLAMCALMAFLWPLTPAAASEPASATISYTSLSWGGLIVPIRLNDKVTARFLLSSALGGSVISKQVAQSLGLTPKSMTIAGQAYEVVTLDRFEFGSAGNVSFTNVPIFVQDMSGPSSDAGAPLDGILGANVLAAMATDVDFQRHSLQVWAPGNLTAAQVRAAGFDPRSAVSLVTDAQGLPYVPATLQSGKTTISERLALATETYSNTLPEADAKALGLIPLTTQDTSSPASQAAPSQARVPKVQLGATTVTAPPFGLSSAAGQPAIIGLEALSQYKILIDGPAKKLYLKPALCIQWIDPAQDEAVIPLNYDPPATPLVIVYARINGHAPMPFVYDTGTSFSLVLDRSVLPKLGLTLDREAVAHSYNGSIPLDSVAIRTFTLDGKTPHDNVQISLEQALVGDLSVVSELNGAPIAGIIGSQLLKQTSVTLDLAAKTMTIHREPRAVAGAEGVPMTMYASEGFYFVPFSPAPGQVTNLLVDTGAAATDVPFTSTAGLNLPAIEFGGERWLGARGTEESLMLPETSVGNVPLNNMEVDATVPDPLPASFGLDAMARFRLTMDFPDMTAYFQPLPNPLIFRPGWAGVGVAQQNGHCEIDHVDPLGPAWVAGLRLGDIVLSVDGRTVQGMPAIYVDSLIAGRAGTVADLTILRPDGKPQTLRVRRSEKAQGTPSAFDGIICRQPDGQPISVYAVLPGYAAAKAGLGAGDRITQIDGVEAASLSDDQFKESLVEKRLTLTVQREGTPAPLQIVVDSSETSPPKQGSAGAASR